MQGSMRRVLPGAAAVGAVIAVGAAVAANSTTFTDRTGDGRPAPDVTAVAISNDDDGNVTIRVTVDRVQLRSTDDILVGIDADQNPDTGTVFYGADVGLDLTGTEQSFLRPSPRGYFTDAPAPESVTATSGGGAVTFTFSAADVGLSPTAGFGVFVATGAPGAGDIAPNIRTVNYQLVAGTERPALGPDRRAPLDEAVPASGTHGKVVRLRYYAADGRAETADTIRVYRARKLLATFRARLQQTNPLREYYVSWKVPKTVKGKLRFCVQSRDRSRNTSNLSCAALTIT